MFFCDYPMLEARETNARGSHELRFRTGGDQRGTCTFRIVATSAEPLPGSMTMKRRRGRGPSFPPRHRRKGIASIVDAGGQYAVRW
jgi:hypothetical protein